jgi:hypothetical protein
MVSQKSAVINQLSGARKELVGMCRFLNNPKVELGSLMEENQLACKNSLNKKESYLVIHDTSDLNFMNHSGKLKVTDQDIGPTGHKDAKGVGFMVHPSLVVARRSGFPKGYSYINIWNRQFGQLDRLQRGYKTKNTEEKESYKWIEGIRSSSWLCEHSTHITHVMDRDSDMYELFILPREKNEDWIVRACQDRCLEDENDNMKDYTSDLPVRCSMTLKIKGNDHRRKRIAKLGLKYDKIKIKRPARALKDLAEYVEVNVVVVEEYESSVPAGDTPIKWILYTTHEIQSIEDAMQIVEWYKKRWIIEELFATLKTRGLCIEDSQLETGTGLKKLTVMALQAALEILQLVKDRDNEYEEDAGIIFSPQAIIFLKALVKTLEGKTEKQKNTFKENSLAWAAWCIGRLGGWKGYKSESPAGPKTMKRGLVKFWNLFEGWSLAHQFGSS